MGAQLPEDVSIGKLLRKVIALGGKADSAELRDWANRGLKEYGPDDEFAPYRKITAPLQIDAGTMHGFIKGR